MIAGHDLHRWAVDRLEPYSASDARAADDFKAYAASEATVRRAVSALYYGLFHRLAGTGAVICSPGFTLLQERLARTHDHGQMRRVCKEFATWSSQPRKPPYEFLAGRHPDPRVTSVAEAFDQLQAARHSADYDLNASFSPAYGIELMVLAEEAHWSMDKLEGTQEERVFLTALLLGDRLKRRG